MVFGENGAVLQNGMGHAVVVFLTVGQAVAGEKNPVHLQPNAVGIDKRAVQIKQDGRDFLIECHKVKYLS